jgi:potassium efflux system protein
MISPLRTWGLELVLSPWDIIVKILLPIAVLSAAYALAMLALRKLRLGEERLRMFRRIARVTAIAVVVAGIFVLLPGSFRLSFWNAVSGIWRFLVTPIFSAGSSQISIITVLLAIPVVLLASWAAKLSRKFLETTILRRLTVDEEIRFTISNLARYGVLILALVVGLSVIGIDLSSLAVLLGVIGIGLGFGLQNVIANYVAGLVIFLERPVKEGDRILVEGMEGDVIQIKLRTTVINTLTNETIIVPNSQLVGNSVHNYSYRDKRIVIVNDVQVSYEADLEKAREALLRAAARNPFALPGRDAEVRVVAFEESGIHLALWTWIALATNKRDALSWTNMEIWRLFKENGIVIPFPQMDLHLKRR